MAPLTRARQLQIRRLIQEHNAYIDYAIAARMHDAPQGTQERDRLNAYLIQRIEDRAARTWIRLPRAERDRFEQVWNIVQDARVAAREARRVADNAHELWTARLRDQPNTIPWGDVHDDMEGVAQEFHNVVITQQLCIDAHNLFIPIVDDICGEITVDYARRGLRNAQRRLARALDAEALWRERADPEHPPIPLRNGKRKLPEHDMPAENNAHRRVRRWRQLRDRQDGYLDDSWEGAWVIGEGGMGVAALWIKEDERGDISERIVRKDAYLTRTDWADATKWNPNASDGYNRVPMEAACLQHPAACSVPTLWHWFSDTALLKYTLYMQYCGLGTLFDVMENYYPHADADDPLDPRKEPIPEPFLWRVFQSLAEVGQAMHKGSLSFGLRKLGWRDIIHRDLKPCNIFLDLPEPGDWEAYPRPFVGDFGLAIRTTEADPLNPQIFLDQGGTSGFLAPEQSSYVEWETREPIDQFLLTSRTNVWGVGKTMFSIAALSFDPRQPHWYGQNPEDDDNSIQCEFRDWKVAHYSLELAQLIDDCLIWDPRIRPSFEDILRRINGAVLVRGDGLRGEIPDGFDEDHSNALVFPDDAYRVDMARGLLRDPDV